MPVMVGFAPVPEEYCDMHSEPVGTVALAVSEIDCLAVVCSAAARFIESAKAIGKIPGNNMAENEVAKGEKEIQLFRAAGQERRLITSSSSLSKSQELNIEIRTRNSYSCSH